VEGLGDRGGVVAADGVYGSAARLGNFAALCERYSAVAIRPKAQTALAANTALQMMIITARLRDSTASRATSGRRRNTMTIRKYAEPKEVTAERQ
jgi:hypothetical protein